MRLRKKQKPHIEQTNPDKSSHEPAVISRPKLWQKLKSQASRLSRSTMQLVLKLYYAAIDDDTPSWAKATIYTALAYFILPLDAIPDFILGGYTDDLTTLTAAVYTITKHIKPEHQEKAEQKLQQWFSGSTEPES